MTSSKEKMRVLLPDYQRIFIEVYHSFLVHMFESQKAALEVYDMKWRMEKIKKSKGSVKKIINDLTDLDNADDIENSLIAHMTKYINTRMETLIKNKEEMKKSTNMLKEKYIHMENVYESSIESKYPNRFLSSIQDSVRYSYSLCAQIENAIFHLKKGHHFSRSLLCNSFKIDNAANEKFGIIICYPIELLIVNNFD